MLTTIYLLRHAAYENPKNIFHGRLPGFPISNEGSLQAYKLAKYFRNKPIDAIYSSPLKRAYQTAKAIAKNHNLKVQRDDRLLDIRTPLQGKPISYMKAIHWNFYRPEFIRAGGERLSEIFKRMHALIQDILRQHVDHHVILVSHGDPIMVVKVKYLGGNIRSRSIFEGDYVPVAGGYCITFTERGKVHSLNRVVL